MSISQITNSSGQVQYHDNYDFDQVEIFQCPSCDKFYNEFQQELYDVPLIHAIVMCDDCLDYEIRNREKE